MMLTSRPPRLLALLPWLTALVVVASVALAAGGVTNGVRTVGRMFELLGQ